MIRQLFTVSTMIMALGIAPAQAYGGTHIQETNQSEDGHLFFFEIEIKLHIITMIMK